MQSTARKFGFVFVMLAITVLFFLPFLTGKVMPYAADFTGSDLTDLNLPLRFTARQLIMSGQLPLWTPLIANGFNLLGEGQAGVFYPPNLAVSLLPFQFYLVATLALHFLLAMLFTYLLARQYGASRVSSLAAGVAFAASGFFIFRFKHLNLISAAIWLPLQWLVLEKFFASGKRHHWLLLLSGILTIQFFAGHPQMSFISVVADFIYFAVKCAAEIKKNIFLAVLTIGKSWLLIGVVALGLSAIQLLPTLSYVTHAERGLTLDYHNITLTGYPLKDIATFFYPYIFGNPATGQYPAAPVNPFGIFWENNGYFGLVPLLAALSAVGWLCRRSRKIGLLTIVAAVSFLLVIGNYNPLFRIIWTVVPGFQLFRFPQRFLLVVVLCGALLSAFGYDYWWRWIKQRLDRHPKIKTGLLPILLSVLLLAAVFVDLAIVSLNYVGQLDTAAYFATPRSIQSLPADADQYRIYSLGWPAVGQSVIHLGNGWQSSLSLQVAARELVAPNTNVFWSIASAQDRASLEGGMLPLALQRFNERLVADNRFYDVGGKTRLVSDQALRLLGMANVKYLFSFQPLSNVHLNQIARVPAAPLPSLEVYENRFALPLAYGVSQVIMSNSGPAALDAVFRPDFDPAKQIVLGSSAVGADAVATSLVAVLKHDSRHLDIAATFSQPAYVFISQTYDSGWRAFVDGQGAAVLPANGAFMAVAVPRGIHQVALVFMPRSFVWGAWISALTLLLCLGGVIVSRRRWRLPSPVKPDEGL